MKSCGLQICSDRSGNVEAHPCGAFYVIGISYHIKNAPGSSIYYHRYQSWDEIIPRYHPSSRLHPSGSTGSLIHVTCATSQATVSLLYPIYFQPDSPVLLRREISPVIRVLKEALSHQLLLSVSRVCGYFAPSMHFSQYSFSS